ncbi:MAG: hypothetical protein CL933_11880 [Deltaproteobacteria bacterium]|nr:hypothetical protein [Deltaproteobacteria bacterium]
MRYPRPLTPTKQFVAFSPTIDSRHRGVDALAGANRGAAPPADLVNLASVIPRFGISDSSERAQPEPRRKTVGA